MIFVAIILILNYFQGRRLNIHEQSILALNYELLKRREEREG